MSRKRQAWVVVDLGFGDAGKGTITDYLVRSKGASLVVRFNGGSQAGHNVVLPDGRHHTFSQFGAGTFVPGVGTHLGPAFVLHPGGLSVEADRLAEVGLADALERLTIDERVTVVTPFQQAAGRLRELTRGAHAHGTCGVGFGEAVGDKVHDDTVRAADLRDPTRLRGLLSRQQERKRAELADARDLQHPLAHPELEWLDDPGAADVIMEHWAPLSAQLRLLDPDATTRRIDGADVVICEGAQGMLLDQSWGFHPHTTWSDCSPRGARSLLGDRITRNIGVTRCYATRHGHGPFPTWDPTWHLPETHNSSDGWQGAFRTGPLDLVLLRYAVEAAGPLDGIAVTCLDRVQSEQPVCRTYAEGLGSGRAGDLEHQRRLGEHLESVVPEITRVTDVVNAIEQTTGLPVVVESRGPTWRDKRSIPAQ